MKLKIKPAKDGLLYDPTTKAPLITPEEFLTNKGLTCRATRTGNQLRVQVCPFCGDGRWKMYMNRDTGQFDCKLCGKTGNMITIDQKIQGGVKSMSEVFGGDKKFNIPKYDVDAGHDALKKSKMAMEYLECRGFDSKTVEYFKLGLINKQGADWIVIPHFKNGVCVNAKLRRLTGNGHKFSRIESDCESVLYNWDRIKVNKPEVIVICEGEMDVMSWHQAGIESVVCSTTGCEGFNADWIDSLIDVQTIYLAFDNDAAGQAAVKKLAERLDANRCYIVQYPEDCNDANEALMAGEDLTAILDNSKQIDIDNIVTMERALDELQEEVELGDGGNGLITPWISVNEKLGKMEGGDLIFLTAQAKTGKCVVSDTEMVDPMTGEMMTIQEWHGRKKEKVFGLDIKDYKLKTYDTRSIYDGKKRCTKLTTVNGKEISTTAEHKYLTPDGWKKTKELSIGDYVAVSNKIPEPMKSVNIGNSKAKLLGYMLGDGSLRQTSYKFTCADEDVIEDFRKNLKTAFSEDKITLMNTARQGEIEYCISRRHRNNDISELKKWIASLGLDGTTSHTKFIPNEVGTWSKENIRNFISGIWTCDGWVSTDKNDKSKKAEVGYCSVSYKLIYRLMILLQRFGITAKIRKKKSTYKYKSGKDDNFAYTLIINDYDNMKKFHDSFTLCPRKQDKLSEILEARDDSRTSYNNNFPPCFWNIIFEEAEKKGLTKISLYQHVIGYKPNSRGHGWRTKGGVNPKTFKKLAEFIESDKLLSIVNGDIIYEKIKSIEPVGWKEVYDLTVPEVTNYYANGFIAHNTSFAMNLLDYYTRRQETPVAGLMYCLEMTPKRLARKTVQMVYKLEDIEIDADAVTKARQEIANVPLFFGYNFRDVSIENVTTTIRLAVKRYDIKFVVFDNLQFLVRDPRAVASQTGMVSRSFKMLAEELDIPIMVLVQPRKLDGNKQVMDADDMRDSSSLPTDCDSCIILHRGMQQEAKGETYMELDDIRSPFTLVRVALTRYTAGGQTPLFFEGKYGTYRECTQEERELLSGGRR